MLQPLGSQTLLQAEIHLSHRPGRTLDVLKLEHVDMLKLPSKLQALGLLHSETLPEAVSGDDHRQHCVHELMRAANHWYYDVLYAILARHKDL